MWLCVEVKPDAIAFNCVLDVCVKAGDIHRARQLVQEMEETLSNAKTDSTETVQKRYRNDPNYKLRGRKRLQTRTCQEQLQIKPRSES